MSGVSFKANLPFHAFLLPHHNSLVGHMDLVIKEVEVMAQRGWVDMLNTIPFYPTRF